MTSDHSKSTSLTRFWPLTCLKIRDMMGMTTLSCIQPELEQSRVLEWFIVQHI